MNPLRRVADRIGAGQHFVLGVITLVIIFGGFVLISAQVIQGLFGPSTRTVTATFANAAELKKASPVRIDGVQVGKVEKITLNPGDRTATVEMAVRKDAPPLYRDATAALRWRLLLGGNYAIELDRGTPGAGELAGQSIPQTRTSSQVELDQVVGTLRSGPRAGIRIMLAELPKALRDRHAPARALRSLADVAPTLTRALRSVRGERLDDDLRALTANTARTVRALDAPTDPVRQVIEGGGATFETTARRKDDVDKTVVRAAAVMPRVQSTLRRLDATLALADPVLDRLREPAAEVAPTVADLRPTVIAADHLLTDARPLLRSLRPAAVALASVARDGRPLLDGLTPSIKRLDTRILPDLAKPDAISKRPTYQMIGPTVASFVAVASNFDAVSHYVALGATPGDPKVDTSGCRTYFTDLKPGQIATCDTLLNTLQRLLNPSPASRR